MSRNSVLLVEDNPNDAMLAINTLTQNNLSYDVIYARDGAEALDYLFGTGKYEGRDTADMPSVMLLDLKLPKVNGFEVLQKMRLGEQLKNLPVVVLTSSDEEKDIIDSYNYGANSYVCKPVDFNKFTEAMKYLVQYWLFLNEPPIARS